MRLRRLTLPILLTLPLAAGCDRLANSPLNPANLFGRGGEVAVTSLAPGSDRRPLVPRIVSLAADPTPYGAVVRAVGLPPEQGFWDAALIEAPSPAPGVLAYTFRAVPPPGATRSSTERSRELTAGVDLSMNDLAGVREIRVTAGANAMAVRR